MGNVEAYKDEDAICTILPIFHIFVVQLLSTGGIQIENASGSVTVSGLVRSGAGVIGLRRHEGNVGIGWEHIAARIYTICQALCPESLTGPVRACAPCLASALPTHPLAPLPLPASSPTRFSSLVFLASSSPVLSPHHIPGSRVCYNSGSLHAPFTLVQALLFIFPFPYSPLASPFPLTCPPDFLGPCFWFSSQSSSRATQ
jgi:hypothetical protein